MKLTKRWRRTHEQEQLRSQSSPFRTHSQSNSYSSAMQMPTFGSMNYFGPTMPGALDLSCSPPNRTKVVDNWLTQNHQHAIGMGPMSPPSTPQPMDLATSHSPTVPTMGVMLTNLHLLASAAVSEIELRKNSIFAC